MIIKRGVKVQLFVFAVITVLSVYYTAVYIVGLGQGVLDLRYKVYAQFSDSGGIFSNAEVTYRGVTVGRVGPLILTKNGVTVELRIDRGKKVPNNHVQAYVLDRSGVGEQYVDLRPAGLGPSLKNGDVIPEADTHLPVQTADLLNNVDNLVKSVNPTDLGTVLTELNNGLSGEAPDLQTLLDSNKKILASLQQSEPATISLLNNGRTALDTQIDEGPNFREFSSNLASLSDELRKGDGDVRSLLDTAPGGIDQANDLLNKLEPTLPVLLANGSVVGSMLTSHISGLRQALLIYPVLTASAFTATPGDGTVHFGLELNFAKPPVCTKGYEGTKIRYPQDTKPATINPKAACTLPKNSESDPRGSRNAPGRDPLPVLPPGATLGAGFPGSVSPDNPAQQTATQVGQDQPATGKQQTAQAASSSASSAQTGLSQLYLTSYDPRTRVFIGPDGKQYRWGLANQLTGDTSWQTLLLSPMIG
jgi:phospholipid/cholesterol/gamma-HCH transport system substrate-binding protein